MQIIHGGDVTSYSQQFPDTQFVDFSANLNPLGQPQSVKNALQNLAQQALHYPDPLCRELKSAISTLENVPAYKIICGNGAADIIYRIAYGLKSGSALILAPTFAEYELALCNAGWQVIHHHLTPENDFALDDSFVEKIETVQLVMLCNPNNPTGQCIEPALMQKIYTRCKTLGITLVVDECFLDFVEQPQLYSLKNKLCDDTELIIIKAFTKTFSVPGIRAGYAFVSTPQTMQKLECAGPPWNVSTVAQLCGIAACSSPQHIVKAAIYIAQQREFLQQKLTDLGIKHYPTRANYILIYCETPNLKEKLCEKGFIIRDCSNYHGLSAGYYRIAVRTNTQNTALISALESIM